MGRRAWRIPTGCSSRRASAAWSAAGGGALGGLEYIARGPQPRRASRRWYPGLVSQSALLWDEVGLHMERVARGQTRISLVA